MVNVLKNGTDWLADTLIDKASVQVTYTTPAGSVVVDAVKGRSDREVEEDPQVLVQYTFQDWIIKRDDLVIASALVTPAEGHTVAETQNSVTYTYSVMDLGGGQEAYDHFDLHRKAFRIHTKLVGTA